MVVPPSALIAAGFLVYFHTSSFSQAYGSKIERIRTAILSKLLEEAPQTTGGTQTAPQNPYFPESVYDDAAVRKIVESKRIEDYRRCTRWSLQGNQKLRRSGLSLMALGLEVAALLLVFPDSWYFLVSGIVIITGVFFLYCFLSYHKLVRDIDEMDSQLQMGYLEVPWRK